MQRNHFLIRTAHRCWGNSSDLHLLVTSPASPTILVHLEHKIPPSQIGHVGIQYWGNGHCAHQYSDLWCSNKLHRSSEFRSRTTSRLLSPPEFPSHLLFSLPSWLSLPLPRPRRALDARPGRGGGRGGVFLARYVCWNSTELCTLARTSLSLQERTERTRREEGRKETAQEETFLWSAEILKMPF